jgi:hypothetical protein
MSSFTTTSMSELQDATTKEEKKETFDQKKSKEKSKEKKKKKNKKKNKKKREIKKKRMKKSMKGIPLDLLLLARYDSHSDLASHHAVVTQQMFDFLL